MPDSSRQDVGFPLPLRLPPQPWEDLASLITRTSERMGYKDPHWIMRPEDIPHHVPVSTVGILHKKSDYEMLGCLFLLDEETIYNLTLHRLASCLQPPEASRVNPEGEVQRTLLATSPLCRLINPHTATKVCPMCLAEKTPYGRLYWNVAPLVSCLKHRIFLEHQCPRCKHPIPLLRLSLLRCPSCRKGDYRQVQARALPEDSYFLAGQQWILEQLGVENGTRRKAIETNAHFPLQRLLPWQYFRLLAAFHCVLLPLFPEHPFLRTSADFCSSLRQLSRTSKELTLSEWSVFISTFHFIFASWPTNFFALLDALPAVNAGASNKSGLVQDFGLFYKCWLYDKLNDPAFSFLREAFEDYINKCYRGGRSRPSSPSISWNENGSPTRARVHW